MSGPVAVFVFVVAWFAAGAVTWIITKTSLLAWFRLVHKARYERRAGELLNGTINQLPPDDPRRWNLLRRYEILVAYAEAPGCIKCVGFWMYTLTALTAWLSLKCPGILWGAQTWFAIPALVLGGWWVFVTIADWLEPPSPAPVTVVR